MSEASLCTFILSFLVHYSCVGPAKMKDSALLSNATTSLKYIQMTSTTIESLQKNNVNDQAIQSTRNDDRQQLSTLKHIERYGTGEGIPPIQYLRRRQDKEKRHRCTTCGKCFHTTSSLKIHHRIHTGEKPHECSECGKYFNQVGNLKRHQKIHTVEKPFLCSDCGRCFSKNAELERHQKAQRGEMPFLCCECGKCFRRANSLKRHQKTHTGEKPFLCSECGKYFNQVGNLKRHQKTHEGAKLFICDKCGRCYSRRGDLELHKDPHTGKKPCRFAVFKNENGYQGSLVCPKTESNTSRVNQMAHATLENGMWSEEAQQCQVTLTDTEININHIMFLAGL